MKYCELFFNQKAPIFPESYWEVLIFPKISTLSFDVEITYVGAFKSQKVDFDHKNLLRQCIGGVQVDFCQNIHFSPWASILQKINTALSKGWSSLTPYAYFQTCWELTSWLRSTSGSEGSKICTVWRGCIGFWDPHFFRMKKTWVTMQKRMKISCDWENQKSIFKDAT